MSEGGMRHFELSSGIGNSNPASQIEPLGVPVGRFFTILRRRAWIVALVLAVGIGGTWAVVMRMNLQYTSEASVLIEPRRTQVSDLQVISQDSGDQNSLMRTQMDILRSQSLAMKVVQTLHLGERPEFQLQEGWFFALLHSLSVKLGLTPSTPASALSPAQQAQIIATMLDRKIAIANEARSGVLRVQVTTDDPKLSAQIANELVQQFLDFKRYEKFAAMQKASDWFQEQLGSIADRMRQSQHQVEEYAKAHGLGEVPQEGLENSALPPTVNRQQLDAISRELVTVAATRAQKESQLSQAQTALHELGRPDALPAVLVSPVIAQLRAQEAAAAARVAQIAASEGDRNPELIALRAQSQRLRTNIQQEMNNIVASLSAEVGAARAQEKVLQQKLEQLRTAVGGENSAQLGLQGLLAKARADRTIYASFLNRATELANVAGIQDPDAGLVAEAIPPIAPSGPKRNRLVAVSAILSTVLGLVAASLAERMRRGFANADELESFLGVPSLTLVPSVGAWARRPAPTGHGAAEFTAALDKLRGRLRALDEERPAVVMVTSALPQEGKSVFAAGLAGNAAAAGWRVLLVECDFRRPSLALQVGVREGPGLREVLTGSLLGDVSAAFRQVSPGLHVVPAGGAGGDPQELLASNRMAKLLDAVRARYDLILLDTPPVLATADALVLARRADATLLIVRWEKTARAVVQSAVRLLRLGAGARVLGTVMTRADRRTAAGAGGLAYLRERQARFLLGRG